MSLFIIGTVLLILFVKYATRPYKPPIFGIYQQENGFYHIKYYLFYLLVTLRQRIAIFKKRNEPNVLLGEFFATKNDCLLDTPQALQDHPKAIDAVYFNGNSKDGAAMVCGVARRPKGVCNAFMYLRIHGGELMLTPKLPDTTLQQTPQEEGRYEVEGIHLYPQEPVMTWKIKYNGDMKLATDSSKTVKVEVDATFKAYYNYFNYDTDISSIAMARAIAKEKWSENFFSILKEIHQSHYEQYGKITGTVKIDDSVHTLELDSVRDHSFGKFREWKSFHRYALHFITTENGDCITVGVISMPVCFSSLTIGFLCRKVDKKIYPVDFCDLELFRHGEDLTPPLDYAFQFKAGGETYTVQVDVSDSPTFFIGDEHESRIVERLAKFKVNGVNGWGAAEWQYRNIDKNII